MYFWISSPAEMMYGHVRIFRLPERRRDADDYRVAFTELAEVGRRRELPASTHFFTFSFGTSTM
jgi:hypothetical protein